MRSKPSLWREYDAVTDQIATLQAKRAAIQEQIGAGSKGRKKRRKKSSHRIDPRGVPDTMTALLTALKGGPLGPGELGAKLEISRGAATKRLEVAVEKKFVERVGYGRYDLTDAARTVLA